MKTKPSWRRREHARQEVEDLIILAMSLGYVLKFEIENILPGYVD